MASRYELYAAYSLLIMHELADRQIWLTSQHLQKYDPVKERILMVPDPNNIDIHSDLRIATAQDIKLAGDNGIGIVNHITTITQSILQKPVFVTLAQAGCVYWGVSLANIGVGCTNNINLKNYWDANKAEDETILLNIGKYIKGLPTAQNKPIGPLPEDVRIVNMIHDLIDAAMYNLKRLKSGNGQPLEDDSIDTVKSYVYQRCRTLLSNRNRAYILASKIYKDDLDLIYSITDHVNTEYPKLNDYKQCDNLASYIETSIPRLPLWRRYWAY